MYFPYLFGQKFELEALRRIAPKLHHTTKVVPIIEPVTVRTDDLIRALSEMERHRVPYLLIVNPGLGDFEANAPEGAEWFNTLRDHILPHASSAIPAFTITPGTNATAVRKFAAKYKGRRLGLIHKAELPKWPELSAQDIHVFSAAHTSEPYQQQCKGCRILLRNGFKKQSKNALYPAVEHYDDLNLNYRAMHFDGFGDYTITGDAFARAGGEAHAVAIHLTRVHPGHRALQMLHFVSDTVTVPPRDNALKYGEAVSKLADFVTKRKLEFRYSDPVQLFVQDASTMTFHGLGEIKGRSIQHHIETIHRIL